MDPTTQFWWNWSVYAVTALGTIGAVIVALFGDRLRASMFPPKLELHLSSRTGGATQVALTAPDGTKRTELARYYHVRLTNAAHWPKATQTQVYLLHVEAPGPDGELQVRWSGDIPVKWRWAQVHPLQRTIGPQAECDLCSIVRNKWLQIHPLVDPSGLKPYLQWPVGTPADFTLVLQARSNEGDSPIQSFRIQWDGKWEDGDAEMMRHLIITESTQQS
jgi:hypothetical protein